MKYLLLIVIPYSNLSDTPTIPTVNNGTLTVQGTGVLGGSGTFTANDSTSPTISITHDSVSRTNNTSTANPDHGDPFTVIDSITTSTEGHVTAVNTKTVTLPADAAGVTSITAGTGLSGGTINTTGTIALSHLGIESLTDPNADRILMWDDSATATAWLTVGSGLSLSGTTLTATATSLTAGKGIDINSSAIDVENDIREHATQIIGNNAGEHTSYNANDIVWYVGNTASMQLDAANQDLLVKGDVVAYSTTTFSDEALKDNIITIDSALDKVNAMRGVEYDWNTGKKEGKHDIGVIAQEVEKILPEIVYSKKDFDGNEFKTVDYEKITAVLIEAVKELSQEVTELKKQINS